MRTVLTLFFGVFTRLGRSRQDFLLKNFALRHQLTTWGAKPHAAHWYS